MKHVPSHNWRHCNLLTLRYNVNNTQWELNSSCTQNTLCNGWQLPFHKWPLYLSLHLFSFNTYIIVMYPTHQSTIYILTNRNSVMKLFKNNFKDWNHICLRKRSLKNAKISHVRSWMITLLLKQKSFVNVLIFHWRKKICYVHLFFFRYSFL